MPLLPGDMLNLLSADSHGVVSESSWNHVGGSAGEWTDDTLSLHPNSTHRRF